MKRSLPYLFLALLASGFIACGPDEDLTPSGPDTIQTAYGEVLISENYVPIDWTDSQNEILSIEVPDSTKAIVTLQLQDKKTAQSIHQGSLLTLDLDTVVYLRKVVTSTVDGTTVTAVTTQGTLEDVFGRSEFAFGMGTPPDDQLYECGFYEDAVYPDEEFPGVTDAQEEEEFFPFEWYDDDDGFYGPAESPWQRGRTDQRSAGAATGRVAARPVERATRSVPYFEPTELRYYDENGQWVHESYTDYKARLTRTRGDDKGVDRWELPNTGDGQLGGKFNIDWTDPDDKRFSFGIEGSAYLRASVGFRMETNYAEGHFKDKYDEGNLMVAPTFFFSPRIDWQVHAYTKFEQKFDREHTKKVKRKQLKEIHGPRLIFAIGPVPVMVNVNGALYLEPEFTLSASFGVKVSGSFYTTSDYELGMRYNQKEHTLTRIFNKPTWDHNMTFPIVQVSGTAEAKLYLYPEFSVELYDVVGPYINFKPYISASISGGFNSGGGLCVSGRLALGKKFGAGIKAEVLGYELMNMPLVEKEIGSEFTLLEAPSSITSATNKNLTIGKLNDITVEVHNKLVIANPLNTWLPCTVCFECGKGRSELYDADATSSAKPMFSKYVDIKNGKAKVMWCPTDKKSSLTASIYSGTGDRLGFVNFRPNNAPKNVEGIDMGTGDDLLWANMNVGASDPEDSGDLVGWGDVSGKHREQAEDPEYGNYVEDRAKCLSYYGGSSPLKNISETGYDYASTNWGGGWRMPTYDEWNRLLKQVSWSYDSDNDCFVATAKNGHKLIFPAAGYDLGNDNSVTMDKYGNQYTGEYWASTLSQKDSSLSWYVGMRGQKTPKVSLGTVARYYRQNVRPVQRR